MVKLTAMSTKARMAFACNNDKGADKEIHIDRKSISNVRGASISCLFLDGTQDNQDYLVGFCMKADDSRFIRLNRPALHAINNSGTF